MIEGSLEVKLPTIWTDEKQRWEDSEKRREERRSKNEIQVREKVGKLRNAVFFQWCVAPEGRKVGSLKRRMRMRDEKFHAVVVRSAFPSQNAQSTMFEPLLEVVMSKKVHVAVARSKLPSQNAQNTSCSDHFWKLWCWKSARRCGAKHMSKSKV